MPPVQKKICLLGDFAVGKTSLVRRYVYARFDDKYLSTIGVKVSRKHLAIPHAGGVVEMTMLLWDLAGSEEFTRMRASYLRGATGAVLVCDLTRQETLAGLVDYARDFLSINPHASLVIAGNKQDLVEQRVITDDDLAAIATQQNQAPCFTSSAKTGKNVETLFQILGQNILARK